MGRIKYLSLRMDKILSAICIRLPSIKSWVKSSLPFLPKRPILKRAFRQNCCGSLPNSIRAAIVRRPSLSTNLRLERIFCRLSVFVSVVNLPLSTPFLRKYSIAVVSISFSEERSTIWLSHVAPIFLKRKFWAAVPFSSCSVLPER